MKDEVADANDVRWYHFLPVMAGFVAVGWMVWLFLALPYSDSRWHVVVLPVVVFILSIFGAWIFHHWSGSEGLAGLAGWLCVIWNKAKYFARHPPVGGVEPKSSRFALLDGLGLIFFALACLAAWLWLWNFGTPVESRVFVSLVLAAFALTCFAFLPGVPSYTEEDWQMRDVETQSERTQELIDLLKNRIRVGEVLKQLRRSNRTASEDGDTAEDDAESESTTSGDDAASHSFKVSLLRTHVISRSKVTPGKPHSFTSETISIDVDPSHLHSKETKGRTLEEVLQDKIVDSRSDEIYSFSVHLEALFRKHNLTRWDRLQTVLAFCQKPNIEYEEFDGALNAGKFVCQDPLETLVNRRGNRNSHTILAACLFHTLGYSCCVIKIQSWDGLPRLALGVMPRVSPFELPETATFLNVKDVQYFYGETTGEWLLGRVPDDLNQETVQVLWSNQV